MQSNTAGTRKRPILVWVIFLYYVLSGPFVALSFYLVFSGAVPLTPSQQSYFGNLTPFDFWLTILLGVANFTGAIALFLLRRLAAYLFSGALVLNVLMTIWHAAEKGWFAAMSVSAGVGALFGLVIALAICLYAWKLARAGVLK